jgi:hypothetical protein
MINQHTIQNPLVAFPLQISVSEDSLIFLVTLVIGLALIYFGFRKWQQMRLIEDTPTSKIQSAPAGRTEIIGTATAADEPLQAPFTDSDCLVATYKIEEWEEEHEEEEEFEDHDGPGAAGQWRTIDSGTLVTPFVLDDGTGTMRVEPDPDATYAIGSEYQTQIRVQETEAVPERIASFLREHTKAQIPAGGRGSTLFSEKRRYTQEIIPPGEELYVLGGTEPNEEKSGNASQRLVLSRDQASGEFIISTEGESDLVSDYKWQAPAAIFGGLLVSAGSLYMLLLSLGVA